MSARKTIYDRFAREYHDYHGISAERAREQLKVLRELEDFAEAPIELVEADAVKGYLAELIDLGGHPNTVRKKRGMVLAFYGWAFDARIVDADRLMRVRRVKAPRGSSGVSTPRPYDRQTMQDFWFDLDQAWPRETDGFLHWFFLRKHCNGRRFAAHGMRLQTEAIARLALHAGLRRNEIFNAPLDDIHYDNDFIVVRFAAAKNERGLSDAREVPMTEALSDSLRAWIDYRAVLNPPHDSPWLRLVRVTDENRLLPMTFDRIRHLLADIGDGYELHRLRHTCATEWLRAGMSLELVRQLLGHATIQQTLAYAKIVKTDLRKGMTASAADFQTAVEGKRAA
jgi:site-specific recombinase XerD